jgi:hypothetical protein
MGAGVACPSSAKAGATIRERNNGTLPATMDMRIIGDSLARSRRSV